MSIESSVGGCLFESKVEFLTLYRLISEELFLKDLLRL